jgi:hypothetical protein
MCGGPVALPTQTSKKVLASANDKVLSSLTESQYGKLKTAIEAVFKPAVPGGRRRAQIRDNTWKQLLQDVHNDRRADDPSAQLGDSMKIASTLYRGSH